MTLSAADVKYELENLRPNLFLEETEDSWEKIGKSIASINKLCENGGYDANASELVTALRSAHRPIVSAMNSERTRLSLIPLELFNTLVSVMGGEFEQLLPLYMQPLLTLCARTNKVVLNRARACIFAIIECSQSASLLTYFLQNIKEKSNTLKVVASEGTLACLNSCNPPDLEKESRAVEIEAIIRATARDAHADVRKISRKLFESYKILLPSRVANFTAPLSPTTKKYLDVKLATVQSKTASNTRSTGPPRAPSKPEVKTLKPSASSSTTSTRHVPSRSVSSTLSLAPINKSKQQPAAMTRVARQEPVAIPAASYAPVRATRVVADAQKTSNVRATSAAAKQAAGPVRSTITQEAKRTLPPLRTAGTVSRTTAAGPASSTGTHRLQLKTTAAALSTFESQTGFTGPRRVPMPAPVAAPAAAPIPMKAKEGPKVSTSNVSSAATSKLRSALVPAASTKSRAPSTLPSAKDRPPSSQPIQTRSGPPSSLLATSTSAVTSSIAVRPLAVAKPKPQWGRSAASMKPVAGAQKPVTTVAAVIKKPSSRILPRAAVPTKKRPVTPAMVALPPSPTPEDNEQVSAAVIEEPIHAEEQPRQEKEGEDMREVANSSSQSNSTPEQKVKEELAIEDADPVVSEDQPEQSEGADGDSHLSHSVEGNGQDDDCSVAPGATSTVPQTPQALLPLPVSSQLAFSAKTPISALLSSIERGFTYSPTTPLSPADLYLPNINGGTPYVHQSHSHTQEPRQPFNYALHGPHANGIFTGFAYDQKREEELVCGEIGVIKVSDHNKLFAHLGMDDMRHAFSQLNQ